MPAFSDWVNELKTWQQQIQAAERLHCGSLAPGEFQSNEKFSRFSYEVNLAEPLVPAELSHVSWLNSERGVLMLADLLPQSHRKFTEV